jgi:hypothetical protein
MRNVFVRPRTIDGNPALVRDPFSHKPLDKDGEWKPASQFWIRRIHQLDVVDATAEQVAKEAADKAAKEAPAPAPSPAAPPLDASAGDQVRAGKQK